MYSLDDLETLMRRLRDPSDGCPWDQKQTFDSIVPHTLEEVYEVVDTIERSDWQHLREELGDLLFQVVFYARLAEEQGDFCLKDVVDSLTRKLLRRHPHVFPEGTLASRAGNEASGDAESVSADWETIKAGEKQQSADVSALADIPLALPAVQRAGKLQRRAARRGFDWDQAEPVWRMLEGELTELRDAEQTGSGSDIEEELGDVLFSVVNLARHLKVDPDRALRRTNRKFEERFRYIEARLEERGETTDRVSLDTLEYYWVEAKNVLRDAARMEGS